MSIDEELIEDENLLSPASAAAWGPASLSNLGPGFDVLGVAIRGLGDRVRVTATATPGYTVRVVGPEWSSELPTNEELNTAAVAARKLFRKVGLETGAEITVYKGIPLGSGIGGSAASAVAGAVAAAEVSKQVTGNHVDLELVAQCALAGERIASGAVHGDNVIPSLVGGVVLVDPTNPRQFSKLQILSGCDIVLLLPASRVLTKTARAILPDNVRLSSATAQAHRLANMLNALECADWERAGQAMMSDELVEPYRAAQVESFGVIRSNAREAGAFACGLTGSGPGMYALLPPGASNAIDVGQAMLAPVRKQQSIARLVCTKVDQAGSHIVEPDDQDSIVSIA